MKRSGVRKFGRTCGECPSRRIAYRGAGNTRAARLVSSHAFEATVLQMPPLGTTMLDEQAVELMQRWIESLEADE